MKEAEFTIYESIPSFNYDSFLKSLKNGVKTAHYYLKRKEKNPNPAKKV